MEKGYNIRVYTHYTVITNVKWSSENRAKLAALWEMTLPAVCIFRAEILQTATDSSTAERNGISLQISTANNSFYSTKTRNVWCTIATDSFKSGTISSIESNKSVLERALYFMNNWTYSNVGKLWRHLSSPFHSISHTHNMIDFRDALTHTLMVRNTA